MIEIAVETRSVYFVAVKKLILFVIASLFLLSVTSSVAGTPASQTSKQEEKVSERLVFITGSLIPQRIQVRRVGTTTLSPVRIIDRQEIDQTGRQTTPGVLINEPSIRVIGH
jgi:outer membrane cobalamin receptor